MRGLPSAATAVTIGPMLAALPREYVFHAPPRETVAGGAGIAPWIIGLAALAATLALTWTVLAVVRRDRRRHGPAYRQLAGALDLGRDDRRLLGRVARTAGLEHAGSLLVSRGCFEMAATRYVQRFGGRTRLRMIAGRVFG